MHQNRIIIISLLCSNHVVAWTFRAFISEMQFNVACEDGKIEHDKDLQY